MFTFLYVTCACISSSDQAVMYLLINILRSDYTKVRISFMCYSCNISFLKQFIRWKYFILTSLCTGVTRLNGAGKE
jgi:hypothetical protein